MEFGRESLKMSYDFFDRFFDSTFTEIFYLEYSLLMELETFERIFILYFDLFKNWHLSHPEN